MWMPVCISKSHSNCLQTFAILSESDCSLQLFAEVKGGRQPVLSRPQLWLKVVIQVAESVAHLISWPLGHWNYLHSFDEYKKTKCNWATSNQFVF